MKLEVSFDNLDAVRQAYDPIVVEKATRSAIKKLTDQTATRVSSTVRQVYNVKARDVSKALKKRVSTQGGIPAGYAIYTGRRLSLRYFSTAGTTGMPRAGSNARPRVKTPRGTRYGARARIKKTSVSKVIKGAFWGHGRVGREDGAGEAQIFQRIGLGRLKIRKLTGPSIAHMMRGEDAQRAVNDEMSKKANQVLSHELDHFMQRQAGIR